MPNTNNPQGGDEPQGIPGIDSLAEPTGKTQADVRGAEEMLVQKLLGVDMAARYLDDSTDEVATRVTTRIASLLVHNRDLILNLHGDLAVQLERNNFTNTRGARERSQILLQSVRNIFPAELVRELVKRLWPTVYRESTTKNIVGLQSHELVIPKSQHIELGGGAGRPVKHKDVILIIDTDHLLWKRTKSDDLEKAIVGKNLVECGIRTIPDTLGRGFTLNDAEAKQIVMATSTSIYRLDTLGDEPVVQNYNGFNVRLKLHHLLAEQAQRWSKQLPTEGDLRDVLLTDPAIWLDYVECVPLRGVTHVPPDSTDVKLRTNLANRATQLLTTTRLGRSTTTLQQVARQQHALHHFSDTLRKGEVNPWDVATAMTMIQQRGELAEVISTMENREELQQSAQRVQFVRNIGQLEASDIPALTQAPGWTMNQIETEIAEIDKDINKMATIGSNLTSIFGAPMGPVATASHGNSLRQQLRERRKELADTQDALKRAADIVVRLYDSLNALPEVQVANFHQLTPLVTPATPGPPATASKINTAQFGLATNVPSLMNHIRSEFPHLREEQYYRDELKKLQEKASKAPAGKDAIHTIYTNYFKGRGLSERESLKSANYLMARNAIDTEQEEITASIAGGAWGVDRDDQLFGVARGGSTWMERIGFQMRGLGFNPFPIPVVSNVPGLRGADTRAQDIMRTLATECGIEWGNDNAARTQNYELADYQSLARYYYALKSLMGGTGVMRLPKYYAVPQAELRSIGTILSRRHTRALLTMFKGQLPGDFDEQDKPVETILGQPEKLKIVLQELLEGDPPESLKSGIQQAMERAGGKFEFWRRTIITNRLVGEKWSLKNAILNKQNPLSVRNVLFGKYGVGTMGLNATKATGRAVAATPKAVWGERKGIATGALLGTLFLPGLGTVIGAGAGGLWRKVMND